METQLRIYGCELIQEGGILLKLPQAVMATAQVLLHRFYVKESLKKFNIKVPLPSPLPLPCCHGHYKTRALFSHQDIHGESTCKVPPWFGRHQ